MKTCIDHQIGSAQTSNPISVHRGHSTPSRRPTPREAEAELPKARRHEEKQLDTQFLKQFNNQNSCHDADGERASSIISNIVINKSAMNKSTKKYNYYFNTKPLKESHKEFGLKTLVKLGQKQDRPKVTRDDDYRLSIERFTNKMKTSPPQNRESYSKLVNHFELL